MNRCRHDIIDDMLKALSTDAKRVPDLCSASNVPVDRGILILSKMEEFGLLFKIEEKGESRYKLTDRGYEWIGHYKHLKKALP
jgi:predicted transcriptional regulator